MAKRVLAPGERDWGETPLRSTTRITAPTVPARTASAAEIPAVVAGLVRRLVGAGWDVDVTYADGFTMGEDPKRIETVAIRAARLGDLDRPDRAVAVWAIRQPDPSNDGAPVRNTNKGAWVRWGRWKRIPMEEWKAMCGIATPAKRKRGASDDAQGTLDLQTEGLPHGGDDAGALP